MPTTLIVTNDFPPRRGGIESFVLDVCGFLDNDVVVFTSATPDSADLDRHLDFEVVRAGPILLPTPAATRRATGLLRRSGAQRVVFGAAAPLGLMARALRAAGATRIVGLTHGHETWWASVPGARPLLRRLADGCDHLTTISDFAAAKIGPALSSDARSRLLRLPPPVDLHVFRPAPGRNDHVPPRCISVGRLVPRKGFASLLVAWRQVIDQWIDPSMPPELILVGGGPERGRIERLIGELDVGHTVRLTGVLARAGVLKELQAADVFAMPVHTRLGGLNAEGLGLVFAEAAACELPVVVGNSGGAPETVIDQVSGFVVDPHDHRQIAARLGRLLADRPLARSMGAAGRALVATKFSAEQARTTLRRALDLP